MPIRYIQVLDVLSYGDAVSNQVLRLHEFLKDRSGRSEIYVNGADPRVANCYGKIQDLLIDDDVILIHHFSGYSQIADRISSLRVKKIIVYHNVTPAAFFDPKVFLYEYCKKGAAQFREIASKYDLVLGDSLFNCKEAENAGAKSTAVLPITVAEFKIHEDATKYSEELRGRSEFIWLFTGRIAPNKRQDLVLDVFAKYIKSYPGHTHHLYLVGSFSKDDPYALKVSSKVKEHNLEGSVTLTGHVNDSELPAYYLAADVFLSMSEHEGFGVPIVEAFKTGVPVLAFSSTAVEETVGRGPGALSSLEIDEAVTMVHSVFHDRKFKEELIRYGIQEAARFTLEAVRTRLGTILDQFESRRTSQSPLRVSIVICTYNRSDYLQRCLDFLMKQDYPHFEVVVVNGPSTDRTNDLLSGRKNIKVVQNPHRNLSISRNLGIKESAGDIVAFIDDDALPHDDWLSKLVARYDDLLPAIVGVGGRTFEAGSFRFQFEDGVIDAFGHNTLAPSNDPIVHNNSQYRLMLGTNCSFRREALIGVKGFDEQYDYFHDESDLAVRLQAAGGIIGHAREAYVRHEFAQSHNRNGKYNFNWFTIAKNSAYFCMKNATSSSIPIRIYKSITHSWKIRCLYFIRGFREKELGALEAGRYILSVLKGTLRGLYDSCFPRKTSNDLGLTTPFVPYLQERKTPESNKKLHVCIISQDFPPKSYGGIGTLYLTIAKQLIQMGHKATVISRGDTDSLRETGPFTHIQVATVECPYSWLDFPILSKNVGWAAKTARLIKDIHRESPIDVIESAVWDFEGIGVLALRPELNIPLVVRLVTPILVAAETNKWQINDDIGLCAKMERELVLQADRVIAISESIQKTFSSLYDITPDRKWSVQLCGLEPWPAYDYASNYNQLPGDFRRGKVQLLFVGRLEQRKGIHILLKALSIALTKDSRISVWIAGFDVENWKEKAEGICTREVLKRIDFLGSVDEIKKDLLYGNCDFVVFPSQYESFGLVALEAMVHGKPVIGARAGAIPEVVIDGKCGFLFPPDDVERLAETILWLSKDKNLLRQMGEGAKKRAEELASRNMAEQSVRLYSDLLINSELTA